MAIQWQCEDIDQIGDAPLEHPGTGEVVAQTGSPTNCVAGSRYLTERDTTFIVEYYHNGAGYNEEQIGAFYGYVDHISGQVPGPANALESALALAPRIIAVVR